VSVSDQLKPGPWPENVSLSVVLWYDCAATIIYTGDMWIINFEDIVTGALMHDQLCHKGEVELKEKLIWLN